MSTTAKKKDSTTPSLPPSVGERQYEEDDSCASDSDFIFSDEVHGQQEYLFLQQSLQNLGLLDDEQKKERKKKHERKAHDVVRKEAFTEGQRESLDLVLKEIDTIQRGYYHTKGMRQSRFAWGLGHCLLCAYVFGAHPGHFWIVYLLESVYWMAHKFVGMYMAQPMSEVLYYLDFCWMMNLTTVIVFGVFCCAGNWLNITARRHLFLACFGLAAGPIQLAAMALPFVAFLFHDVNTMANLIIHVLPSMLCYVLRWKADSMQEAYPNLFDLDYVLEGDKIPFWNSSVEHGSVGRNALLIYLAWFVPYVLFMLSIGLQLPTKKQGKTPRYDTVFHSLWRGGPCEIFGKLLWKRSKEVSREQCKDDNYEVRDFLFYIVAHLCVCNLLGVQLLARFCFWKEWAHGVVLVLTLAICAHRGGQRYSYYATAMYGHRIRKHFNSLLLEENTSKKTK